MIDLLTYNPSHRAHNLDLLLGPLLPNLNVVALQEGKAQVSRIEHIFGPEWTGFGLDTPTPMWVNTNELFVRFFGQLWLSPETKVGPKGAGPDTLLMKHANIVAVQDKDSQLWQWLANHHDAPTIEVPVRDQLHEMQQENLLDFLKRQRGRKLAFGDWNATWGHSNMEPWRDAGAVQLGPKGATHKKRRIDYGVGLGSWEFVSGERHTGLLRDDHLAIEMHLR